MNTFLVLCVNTFAAYIGALPLLIILQFLFRRSQLPKRHQFGLYLYALTICFILMSTDSPSLYQLKLAPSFNLIPFYRFTDNYIHYLQAFVVFVPFGLLLPSLWEQFRSLKKTLFHGLLFSAFIELSQIFCLQATATTDITDILANILGTLTGYLLSTQMCKFAFMGRVCLTGKTRQKERLASKEACLYFLAPWLVTFLVTPFISNALWDFIWNNAVGMAM